MYKNLYRSDPEKGNLIIDVSLDYYNEFFHEWDNATFPTRDMNPELVEFLEVCSGDIPLRKHIEIVFGVSKENRDLKQESFIIESYNNYFGFFLRQEKKKLRNMLFKAIILSILALALIFFHSILGSRLPDAVAPEVFLEGVLIGAWVFMWEAIHLISFQSTEIIGSIRKYRRFLKASIIFTYKFSKK